MNKNNKTNKKVKVLTILLAILMTGVYMNFLPKHSDIFSNSKIENDESDEINNPDKPLKVGIYKFDQWWNKSFAY